MLCISSFFHTILHHSTVIQGNSFGVLFNGFLAELPAFLDGFLPVPQVITKGWLAGGDGEPRSGREKHTSCIDIS